ncbi:MAG: DUF5916 domain-containing protein [Bacteroidota bacterium]
MLRSIVGICGVIYLLTSSVYSQEQFLFVPSTEETPHLDGQLNEPIWQNACSTIEFAMNYPTDTLMARSQTEVKVISNRQYLYIGAVCHHPTSAQYIVQSLKRDFDFATNDGFAVFIDAFSDGTSGLSFAVNPFGVQRDGIIPNGGVRGVEESWDGLWYVETFRNPGQGYWSVEMAIPYKSLRFSDNQENWRINFARNDQGRNELSVWSPVPLGFDVANMAFSGGLVWERPPRASGLNINLIPYVAAGKSVDRENNNQQDHLLEAGLDGKIALSSSMNLDLTFNPDFSQVEVDQQQIDWQRFELFFPEKRLFFLENSDLFAELGNSRVRPFFSRRIGSAGDRPVPIHFGARLSGKVDQDWRLGLMSMQTRPDPYSSQPSQNYTVMALQRKVLQRSGLTAFFINRQSFEEGEFDTRDFNRVGGLEFDYRSADAKWAGKAFAHYALNPPEQFHNGLAYSGKLRYRNRKMSVFLGMDAVGEDYLTDVGYVPRLYHNAVDSTYQVPYIDLRSNGYYRFFLPQNKRLDYLEAQIRMDYYLDHPSFQFQEHQAELRLRLRLLNASEWELSIRDFTTKVFFPLSLSGLEQVIPVDSYRNQGLRLSYQSAPREQLFGSLRLSYEGAYKGRRLRGEGALNFRAGARFVLGTTAAMQQLRQFPADYGGATFWLLGSRIELSFTRNLFFTTFLQYNTQRQNFNINSRFNWRFHPLSDVFLVYTENYLTEGISVRNRALVLKVSYWLN